jgi:predicted HAD superfamily Cof-like phosphohydrolase
MLEECLETINKGLGLDVVVGDGEGRTTFIDIIMVQFDHAKAPNLIEIADGLADLEVVSSCGTATSCGIAMQPIFEIVANDNLLKFAPGHSFDAGGKLIKPKGHRGPTDLIKRELIRQGADI